MIDLRLLARLEMGYTPIIKTQVLQRLGATLMGRHRSRLDVTWRSSSRWCRCGPSGDSCDVWRCAFEIAAGEWWYAKVGKPFASSSHRIHGAAMITWIPSMSAPLMLAYIPAPWILWGIMRGFWVAHVKRWFCKERLTVFGIHWKSQVATVACWQLNQMDANCLSQLIR